MKRTWNIMKYLIIFGANLLMLFFLHAYFNLIILIFMLILPAVSVIAAKYATERLEVSFSGVKEDIGIENPFLIRIVVDNPAWFPLLNVNIKLQVGNLFMQQSDIHVLNVPAYAKKKQETQYMLKSDYIGILQVEVQQIQVMDWLGFAMFHKVCTAKRELVLLPEDCLQVEPDMTAVSVGMTEVEESRQKGNDFSEVQDVREYQPGDKLQNIHWKLSAKKDILMVKDRVSMSSSRLVVVVELYQDETMILNRIVTAAYGVAKTLLDSQIPYEIRWWSVRMQDMKCCVIENVNMLRSWIEELYYEEPYVQMDYARTVMQGTAQEVTRYMVVGCANADAGDIAFVYGDDVAGYIYSD